MRRVILLDGPWPRRAVTWLWHRMWMAIGSGFARHRVIATMLGVWLMYAGWLTLTRYLWWCLGVALALIVAAAVWRDRWPVSYTAHVTMRVRAWWRSVRIYRRGWQPAMVLSGLGTSWGDREEVPPLATGATSTPTTDVMWARMLPGQIVDDWQSVADRLAQSFSSPHCRVGVTEHPQMVQLTFLRHDPLRETVPPIEPSEECIYPKALPVARAESGEIFHLPLHGSHLLLAGASGAGKSAALWSIIHSFWPIIGFGVELWIADPKGGLEMYAARDMCTRFVYGGDEDSPMREFAEMLEDAVALMRDRQARMRGVSREHTPTPECPWIVILVDEIASLTAYNLDRDAKKRIETALNLLLSQGRACGITVIGALQDPRKEVLSMRDLFTYRIGLRMTEPEHVSMVLGDGARRRGAACDHISAETPGVAYVVADGVSGFERIRFSYLSDQDIDYMTNAHSMLRELEGKDAA